MKEQPVPETTSHGINAAYYASDGERYYPFLECICGFSSSRSARSWEDAGQELDEHLKTVEVKD